jgi:hypothetical protein
MWDIYDGDLEELKCQYSIKIAAGSTGAQAKQKRIESLERAFKLMESVNATQPMPVFDTVKLGEEILREYDLPHPERFILGPQMPQGMPPPGGPEGGGPPMDGNDPNAQGANGVGPGGQPPMPTMPGESELGAAPPQ